MTYHHNVTRYKNGIRMENERKERDEMNQFYTQAAALEASVLQHASFESRTLKRYESGEMKRKAEEIAKKAQLQLSRRRSKLSLLLQSDDDRFQQLLLKQNETPAIRRERLLDQLNILRSKRQHEHDIYVKERNEQAWRDQCDPLRRQVSEALEKEVLAIRNQQVIEHDLARMKAENDDDKYIEAIKQQTEEWKQNLIAEREAKHLQQQQNRRVWGQEIAMHKKRDEEEKQKIYRESLEFQITTEAAIKRAQEAAAAKAAAQAARRHELDILNNDNISRKKAEIEAEKALDLEYSRKAAEEKRQQEEDEFVARIVAQRKANLNGQFLRSQLNMKKENDDLTEKYISDASNEYNQREDDRRAKEEERRHKLLLDVNENRKKMIAMHLQQRKLKELEKIEESKKLEEDIAEKIRMENEERENKQRLMQSQNEMLENQLKYKRELERKRKQELQDEINATIAHWKAEEAKIQEELSNPHFLSTSGKFRGHR